MAAVGVALTLTLTAGGLAWKTYLPEYFPGGLTDATELADTSSETTGDSEAASDAEEATADTGSHRPTADSVVDDLFETEDEVPQVRQASAEVPGRGSQRRVVMPEDENDVPDSDEFDSLASGDDLQEEPVPSAQSEPEEDSDLVEEAVPPRSLSHETPTFGTVNESVLDNDSSPPLTIRRGPAFTPPGEFSEEEDVLDAPQGTETEEPPALRFGRDAVEPDEPEAPAVLSTTIC